MIDDAIVPARSPFSYFFPVSQRGISFLSYLLQNIVAGEHGQVPHFMGWGPGGNALAAAPLKGGASCGLSAYDPGPRPPFRDCCILFCFLLQRR